MSIHTYRRGGVDTGALLFLGGARQFREGPLGGFGGWDLAMRIFRELGQGQNTKFQAWKTKM